MPRKYLRSPTLTPHQIWGSRAAKASLESATFNQASAKIENLRPAPKLPFRAVPHLYLIGNDSDRLGALLADLHRTSKDDSRRFTTESERKKATQDLTSMESAAKKEVLLSPLDSALTKMATRNPFRICTYEKRGRGYPPPLFAVLRRPFPLTLKEIKSGIKSFVCCSYENTRERATFQRQ